MFVPFSESWPDAFVCGFTESEATMPTFTIPVTWSRIVVVTIILQTAIVEVDTRDGGSRRNRFLDTHTAMLVVDDSNVEDDDV